MLTLALAMGFFYVVLQNYEIFGGHIGFAGILGPTGSPRENPAAFYYLCLVSATLVYLGLRYLVRSQLGLTFQGIRDNPRRMRALGYRVGLHRIALFAIGGFVAGVSGVLGVWYRGNISPGIVDLTRTIDVLIIAVIGGLGYPIGAFVGAVVFILIDVFASSVKVFGFSFDERFNTLIGLGFVLIVLVAPNGLVGLGGPPVAVGRAPARGRAAARHRPARRRGGHRPEPRRGPPNPPNPPVARRRRPDPEPLAAQEEESKGRLASQRVTHIPRVQHGGERRSDVPFHDRPTAGHSRGSVELVASTAACGGGSQQRAHQDRRPRDPGGTVRGARARTGFRGIEQALNPFAPKKLATATGSSTDARSPSSRKARTPRRRSRSRRPRSSSSRTTSTS